MTGNGAPPGVLLPREIRRGLAHATAREDALLDVATAALNQPRPSVELCEAVNQWLDIVQHPCRDRTRER